MNGTPFLPIGEGLALAWKWGGPASRGLLGCCDAQKGGSPAIVHFDQFTHEEILYRSGSITLQYNLRGQD